MGIGVGGEESGSVVFSFDFLLIYNSERKLLIGTPSYCFLLFSLLRLGLKGSYTKLLLHLDNINLFCMI